MIEGHFKVEGHVQFHFKIVVTLKVSSFKRKEFGGSTPMFLTIGS